MPEEPIDNELSDFEKSDFGRINPMFFTSVGFALFSFTVRTLSK